MVDLSMAMLVIIRVYLQQLLSCASPRAWSCHEGFPPRRSAGWPDHGVPMGSIHRWGEKTWRDGGRFAPGDFKDP